MSTASIASFRKVTPQVLYAQRLAMSNDVPTATKGEVAIALKRAAKPLGIDGSAYHVLDILLGLSKANDWKSGSQPIVAISNEKLADYVCRSERTVIRAIKRLVEAGVLAYKDSSTGRRWVQREKDGSISGRAYGLTFRPAQVRIHEIRKLADEYQAKLNAVREARRGVTKWSRAIVDVMNGSEDGLDLSDFRDQLDRIVAADIEVRAKAEALKTLYEALVDALTHNARADKPAKEADNMSSEGDINDTPYNSTNPQSHQNLYMNKRTSANADEVDLLSDDAGFTVADMAPEKEQGAGHVPNNDLSSQRKRLRGGDFTHSEVLREISISLLESACTAVQGDWGLSIKSWPELCSAAETLRVGIGLSESAYADACGRLGRNAAAAILVVVAEKALRDPERMSSPGGYFRACVERAGEGRLALSKSVFGLVSGHL
ncbi:plasmid replication protein RepC [Roseibium aggregatum]|uniref:Replication initiation protein RepC n=1 Tax=Roseibium aggregatum TaxID=187304 RepID=A0A0M6YCA8_9HYPH|nr:plasmid replication protein RepC [Roseibium aggregatum]CTQ47334.1 replication initiation protein RepC [Roseibium aggregatum]